MSIKDFIQYKSELPGIEPDTIFSIGNLPISNAMFMGVFVTIIVAAIAFTINRTIKMRPSKFQTVVEIAVQAFLDQCVQVLRSKKVGGQLLPLVGAIFIFFGFSNLITLIPGVTSFTFDGLPVFRTATNDFNMTFPVALGIILLTQWASIRKFGIFKHLGKFFKIKEVLVAVRDGFVEGKKKSFLHGILKAFAKGMLAIVDFFLGLLDIISEVAKAFSLSLRLFGNMFAGDILAALLLGAFALVVPAILVGFNLMVGAIQALVFGVLTAAYYGLAISDDSEPATDS